MTLQKNPIHLLSLLVISACSNQATYDSLQRSRLQECNQIIEETLRNECVAQNKLSYKEYEKNREKLLNDEN